MRYYSIAEARTIRTQCKNSTAGSSNMISVKVKDYCSVIAICLVVFFSSASASNSSCPAWFYFNNSTQDCECGRWLDCSNDNKVLIENDYCATSSGQGDQYYIGICLFGHPVNRTNRMYSEMPSDPDMLDDVMCGPYNRKGLLCGECIDGYGPPVYSFDMKCVNCSKLSPGYAVALYLVLALLPTTLFFICLIVFRFNITAGPLLGHIIFCQLYIEFLKENIFIHEYIQSHVSPSIKALFKFSLTLSQFWNFDYLYTVIPPFCISEKLTNIEVKMLDFVPATYPIVLVIMTCILMELHARNCRMVHILWKPFGIILNKTNITTGVTSDAVIHAFASFILLSNVKVLTTTAAILLYTEISSYNGLNKQVLLYQPNMELFGTRHIIYTSIAAVPCIMVTIIPSLVLTIYPTRIYRCLSRYLSARKRLALTAFAEALNSHLKDGLNGTRDYRWCAGFSLFGIVLYELTRNIIESILLFNPVILQIFIVMFFAALISYVHPCKTATANLSLSFHFLLIGFGAILEHEWLYDLNTEDSKLELSIVTLPLISHALMWIWAGYMLICYAKRSQYNPAGHKVMLIDILRSVKQYFGNKRRCNYQEIHPY